MPYPDPKTNRYMSGPFAGMTPYEVTKMPLEEFQGRSRAYHGYATPSPTSETGAGGESFARCLDCGWEGFYPQGSVSHKCPTKTIAPYPTPAQHEASIAQAKEWGQKKNLINGRIFCFTGSLDALTREGAVQLVRDGGGTVHKDLTKRTDYLVCGIRANEFMLKFAEVWSIPTLYEDDFRSLLTGRKMAVLTENTPPIQDAPGKEGRRFDFEI